MKKALIIFLILTSCGEIGDYGKQANDGDIVYYGDSITAICAPNTLNRAVPGSTSHDVLDKVLYFSNKDGHTEYRMLIGINDIIKGVDEGYLTRMNETFSLLKGNSVIVTSILSTMSTDTNARALELNKGLQALTEIFGFSYRDLSGVIGPEHLSDGLHLNKSGCEIFNAS